MIEAESKQGLTETLDRHAALKLRDPGPGDLGWVVQRHGVIFNREFGWDVTFEALIAEIVARYVREHRPATDRCWIAESRGTLVGSIFFVGEASRIGRLRLLCVEPSARGLGVGRALVRAVLDHARDKEFERVTLWTSSLLKSARPIYQAEGFILSRETSVTLFGRSFQGQDWDLVL